MATTAPHPTPRARGRLAGRTEARLVITLDGRCFIEASGPEARRKLQLLADRIGPVVEMLHGVESAERRALGMAPAPTLEGCPCACAEGAGT